MSIAQKIAQLLREKIAHSVIKTVRVGDPGRIAEAALPAIFVTETQGMFELDSTMTDEVTHSLLIQVAVNKKAKLGSGREPEDYIDDLIYGVDDNHTLKANTVIGILRYNLTIDGYSVGNSITYIKDQFPREGNIITYEGHIELELKRQIKVVNRT